MNYKVVNLQVTGLTVVACVAVIASGWAQVQAPNWVIGSARCRLVVEKGDGPWPATMGYAEVAPNGGDARTCVPTVVTTNGTIVGSQVLWGATGEPIKVIFDTSSGATTYHIYIGDARLPLAPNWKPDAGIILETRKRVSGTAENWPEFKKMWEGSTTIMGRSMVREIFHGIHLHGPTLDYLSYYRGFFPIKDAGEYTFATVSDDASFMFIDDKVVAQAPGTHGAGDAVRGKYSGKITLAAGNHVIEYFHVQGEGESCAEAAWQPLGRDRLEVMNANSFLPVANFQVKSYERSRFTPSGAYFDWQVRDHSMVGDQVLVTMEFSAQVEEKGAVCRWVFDDGTVATGNPVRHVFVRTGLHRAKLDVMDGNRRVGTMLETVSVHPNWPQRAEWSDEIFARQKEELLNRDLSGTAVDDLAYLVELADRIHDEDLLTHVGSVCMKRPAEFGAQRAETFYRLGFHFQQPDVRQYAQAEKAFRTVLELNPTQPGLVDRARLRLAEYLIQAANNPQEAEQLLAKVDDQPLTNEERRLKRILLADALLARGDMEGARKGYLAVTDQGAMADVRGALRRRARLESAKAFVLKAEYDAAAELLEQIEWEMPLERLSTETGLAMIEVNTKRKEYPFALARCLRLLHAAETERARAELLYELADVNFMVGNNPMAKEVLAKLLKDHPYTEAAARAKDKWGG